MSSQPGMSRAELRRRNVSKRPRRPSPQLGIIAFVVVALLLTGWALRSRAVGADAGCRGSATPLTVAVSIDAGPLMTKFADDFSESGRDSRGRCVAAKVIVKTSGQTMSALVAGWPSSAGPRPDVWSPSGKIWLPLLEQRLAAAQRPSMLPTMNTVPRIATSPTVVAMPRPMAEALGWPKKAIGWRDLLGLATDPAGWGKHGHPEWGKFLFGKTNPNFSRAGLEGTIATYYAATGRTSGLTREAIENGRTRQFVAGVEQSVIRYGDYTAAFLSDWQRADDAGEAMTFLSALVSEENLVMSYNEGNPTDDPAKAGQHAPPKVPLVAVYPAEGTFIADHPYAVLSAPWVDEAKRDAAQAFLQYLLTKPVQETWQEHHFRDAEGRPADDVDADKGVLADQPGKILEVPSAEMTNAVIESWTQLRKKANVINLIDVSGSMAETEPGAKGSKLDATKKAAAEGMSLFTDQDQVGLWTFSGGTGKGRDWTSVVDAGPMNMAMGKVTRREALVKAVNGLKPTKGNTGLYASIDAAYQTILKNYKNDQINAIVVLTDGRNDAAGGPSLEELLAKLKNTAGGREVRVVTIAYGADADRQVLAQIAQATKGAAYVSASTADIGRIYGLALSNL